MNTGGPVNKNEPPQDSLYWNLWAMGPPVIDSMTRTQFYAELQSQTYPTDTILIYNQNDFSYCDILQDAVQSAITKETESHYSSLQFALYYLNNELDDRMHKYETV